MARWRVVGASGVGEVGRGSMGWFLNGRRAAFSLQLPKKSLLNKEWHRAGAKLQVFRDILFFCLVIVNIEYFMLCWFLEVEFICFCRIHVFMFTNQFFFHI